MVAVANDSSGAVVVLNERTTASLPFHAESTYFYAHKRSRAHLHTQRIQHSAQQQRQPLKNTRLCVHENKRQGKARQRKTTSATAREGGQPTTANSVVVDVRSLKTGTRNVASAGLAWLYHIFFTHRIASGRTRGEMAAELRSWQRRIRARTLLPLSARPPPRRPRYRGGHTVAGYADLVVVVGGGSGGRRRPALSSSRDRALFSLFIAARFTVQHTAYTLFVAMQENLHSKKLKYVEGAEACVYSAVLFLDASNKFFDISCQKNVK